MQNTHFQRLFIFSAVLILGAVAISTSCKRNKSCDLVINVVNGNNNAPVYGASVHVFVPTQAPTPSSVGQPGNLAIQDQTGITDNTGSVSFTFKYPGVLTASVTPASNPPNPGSHPVHLEEGKQVSTTIKLY
ncbi:MAG TPA: hypothetical protein VII99_11745 [Bacteroidia bacterium]